MVMKKQGVFVMKKIAFLGIAALTAFVLVFATCSNGSTSKDPDPEDIIEMVKITGGTFTMGYDITLTLGNPNREKPPHSVTVGNFYIGKYVVTQKEWATVMGTTITQQPGFSDGYPMGDKFPMYFVSWYDAVEFCNKLSEMEGFDPVYTINKTSVDSNNTNTDAQDPFKWTVSMNITANGYRLPTEAEWEYACRAGTTKLYSVPAPSGADTISEAEANFNSSDIVMVGTYNPNAWGLYDMHGNVLEWCWDWFDELYYSSSPTNKPLGPTTGAQRITRGGKYNHDLMDNLRSSYRERTRPGNNNYEDLGFRVVRSIP
jgi:formylglycine-generating enzyme required for sulfatase activity